MQLKRFVLVGFALWALSVALASPVVVMQGADVNTLDPTMNREVPTYNVNINIFDGLLFKEPDGTISAGLAASWELIDDLTWEFDLRQGVTFHNGEPFNAEAVRFTIERILDPETESPISGGFRFIESVEVVDDYTIRFTMANPQPLAEAVLSELLIVPPAYFTEVGEDEFAQNPVGTGPFRFVSWQPDVAVELVANEDYWRGTPAIPELTFRPVPEAITRFAALSSGEADLIVNVPPSLLQQIDDLPQARLIDVASGRVIFIGINTLEDTPLQDPRVRRALNYAVDVDAIIEGVLAGLGTPTTTVLTEIDFGYDASLSPHGYDPERAQELLTEAGYPEGFSLNFQTPDGRYLNDVQVAQAIAGQLEEIGLSVNFEVREYGSFVGDIFGRNASDLYLLGWGNPYFDADYIFHPLFHSNGLISYYQNEVLDDLITQGRTTIDPEARLEAYAEAVPLVHEEAPLIFLYKQQDAYGLSERLDWSPRADEFLWLYDAELR